MSTVVKVENLNKKYILNRQGGERYVALRDVISNKAKNLFSPSRLKPNQEEFLALQNINFEIRDGDRVGIIGRNGAGKSTLLKILSRITDPSGGRISLKGRVASLLEVGTGFHPELTGRENIFLNGAILGMSKRDIKKRFDEIVAFAEVERFLDTPVKRYSSGMYVRLAFAVAAHIEPEILIVDEVLAVGDAQFQKKCLGRMEEVGKEGRTVIFVSHSMQAVKHLCNKGLMLDKGQLIFDGSIDEAVSLYLKKNVNQNENTIFEQLSSISKDDVFSFDEIFLTQGSHQVSMHGENGKTTEVNVLFTVNESTPNLRVLFDVFDEAGTLIFRSFNDENQNGMSILEAGKYHYKIVIPADFFAPKKYHFKFNATIYNIRYIYREPLDLSVEFERTGIANRSYPEEPIRGLIAPYFNWKSVK